MDLVPEHLMRTLRYVEALTRQGIAPTQAEVDAFATEPTPSPAKSMSAISRAMSLSSFYAETLVNRAEPVVAYCKKMAWLDVVGDRVSLTPRGHAVLTAATDDARSAAATGANVVLLDVDGAWLNLELAGALQTAGAGMVVDPFLGPEQVKWIVENTSIRRFLAAPQARNLRQLGPALLADLEGRDEACDVRICTGKNLHDRAIVAADGKVTAMGNSLNGVGKKLSIMVTMTSLASRAYADALESLWNSATILSPSAVV